MRTAYNIAPLKITKLQRSNIATAASDNGVYVTQQTHTSQAFCSPRAPCGNRTPFFLRESNPFFFTGIEPLFFYGNRTPFFLRESNPFFFTGIEPPFIFSPGIELHDPSEFHSKFSLLIHRPQAAEAAPRLPCNL
jgi:hypothetical protein